MASHLTDLEQLLLLAVLRQPAAAHGGAVQEDIREVAGRRVSLGTIHLTMSRLEGRGLIHSEMGEPTGGRGGKARRLYRVTSAGRAELKRTRDIFDRMWSDVPQEAG